MRKAPAPVINCFRVYVQGSLEQTRAQLFSLHQRHQTVFTRVSAHTWWGPDAKTFFLISQLIRFTFTHVCLYGVSRAAPHAEHHVFCDSRGYFSALTEWLMQRNNHAQWRNNNYACCSWGWSLHSASFAFITLSKPYSLKSQACLRLENNVSIHLRHQMHILQWFREMAD